MRKTDAHLRELGEEERLRLEQRDVDILQCVLDERDGLLQAHELAHRAGRRRRGDDHHGRVAAPELFDVAQVQNEARVQEEEHGDRVPDPVAVGSKQSISHILRSFAISPEYIKDFLRLFAISPEYIKYFLRSFAIFPSYP